MHATVGSDDRLTVRGALGWLVWAILLNADRVLLGNLAPVRLHDTFDSVMPSLAAAASNMREFGLVSRLPQALSGVSSYVLAPFPNTMLLTQLVLSPAANYALHSVLAVFVAALGMWLLLRQDMNLSREAGLVGAIFFSSLHRYLPLGLSIAGLPLLLWTVERVLDPEARRSVRLASLGYVLIYFNSTFFALVVYAVIPFHFAYAYFRWRGRHVRRRWIGLGLLWAVYFLFNGPTVAELLTVSDTSQRLSRPGGWRPWTEILSGIARGLVRVDANGWFVNGPTLLGFALLGAYVYVLLRERTRPSSGIVASLAVFGAILAISGVYVSSLGYAVRSRLGTLRTLQLDRVGFLSVFVMGLLIAHLTHEVVVATRGTTSRRALEMAASGGVAALAALVVARGLGVVWPGVNSIAQLLAVVILLGGIALAGARVPKVTSSMLIVVSALVLAIGVSCGGRLAYEAQSVRRLTQSPAIAAIAELDGARDGEFRVVLGRTAGTSLKDPGVLMSYGLHTADGYSPIYPQTYKDVWEAVIEPELRASDRFRDYFLGWGGRAYLFDSEDGGGASPPFSLELLRFLGVRFVIAEQPLEYAVPAGLELFSAPPEDGPSETRFGRFRDPAAAYVYELPGANPIAFGSSSLRLFDSDGALLEALRGATAEELGDTTFGLAEEWRDSSLETSPAQPPVVDSLVLSPDSVRATVRCEGRSILNVTRNYNPGWTAAIDGQRVDLRRAYHSFMAVEIPAGEHDVVLEYRNPMLAVALWAMLVGVPLLLGILWFLVIR